MGALTTRVGRTPFWNLRFPKGPSAQTEGLQGPKTTQGVELGFRVQGWSMEFGFRV